MISWKKGARRWSAFALLVGCSLDERAPTVTHQPVLPVCDPGTNAARCVDSYIERCSEMGEWQREPAPCERRCEAGRCVEPDEPPTPSGCINDGDSCDDGLFCTVGDTCTAGRCVGMARDCDDGVTCTVGDACDEAADRCAPGAVQCPSGQLCIAASGQCGASCSGCTLAGICHADGAANPANPCELCSAATSPGSFIAAEASVSCDDASACTQEDHCSDGRCAGCTAAQRCNESTGACESLTSACSMGGQLVCVDGDVHECDATLSSTRLSRECDIGCNPSATPVDCVGAYALTLDAAALQITRGASASVTLTLARPEAHTLTVNVAVLGLPPGVEAGALQLPGDTDIATLTFSADERAAEGVSTTVTVRASDGFSEVDQELSLFVRGVPGSLDRSFGDAGVARAAPPGVPGFQGTRVTVDAEDRILVHATSRFVLDPLGVPARASLTRFASDGSLDSNFADGGTYLETPGSASLGEGPVTFVGGVALAPGGYVLAGPLGEGVVQEASYVTRLDLDGKRAAEFTAPSIGGGLRLTDVAVENGLIFAAGGNLGSAALYRSDLTGAAEARFTDFSILATMRAVFWSPADNDFILAGNCDPSACFARFNDAGDLRELALDRVTEVTPSTASFVDATADNAGRYFAITSGWDLVRFLPEAVRPPGAGAFSVVVDELSASGSQPRGIARSGDRLYVAAALPDPGNETGLPALVRYSAAFARDPSFGAGGLAALTGKVDVGSSVDVALQSDGRAIVASVEEGQLVVYRVWN